MANTLNVPDIACDTLRVRQVLNIPDNSITGNKIDTTTPIQDNKMLYLHRGQAADNYATAIATTFRRILHIARGAGVLLGFRVTCAQPFVGDSTATVEFYKNGVTVLTADIDLNSTVIAAAYDIVDGSIVASPADEYAAEDVFEVVVTAATVGTGTLGRGFYAEAFFQEEFNP
jgi:hypothetical protein